MQKFLGFQEIVCNNYYMVYTICTIITLATLVIPGWFMVMDIIAKKDEAKERKEFINCLNQVMEEGRGY